MDDLIISRTVQWIRENIDSRMSKSAIAEKAMASNLPPEAKESFVGLPDGEYAQSEVIARVQDDLISRIGAANQTMHGFGGSA